MANICDNELRIYSENSDNLKYITKFFEKEYPGYVSSIEETDELDLTIYFESKWDFPHKIMDDLFEGLPNKDSINMTCLSVEWGNAYCAFHSCDSDGWYFND